MKKRGMICGKGSTRALGLVGLLMVFWACVPGEMSEKAELMVFAAASLTDALNEVGGIYERQSKVDLVFNFAGSNVLAQQIRASSRAGVFVSADEEWMNRVERAGHIEAGTRRSLLSNTLAVIAHPRASWEMDNGIDLCRLDFRFLALGDPEAVPAGRYAKQWLQNLSCDGRTLWETVSERVSPAPDVRAVLGQVEAIAGVIGIVYRTDYLVARDRAKLLHAVSVEDGPPIRYVVARLQQGTHAEVAKLFFEFLHSNVARAIFEKHGFETMWDQS